MGGSFYLRAGQRAFCAGARDSEKEGRKRELGGWVQSGGGDENATDTGKSFVCRYQNQVQESGAHTGFHIHVMVKKECNWG